VSQKKQDTIFNHNFDKWTASKSSTPTVCVIKRCLRPAALSVDAKQTAEELRCQQAGMQY